MNLSITCLQILFKCLLIPSSMVPGNFKWCKENKPCLYELPNINNDTWYYLSKCKFHTVWFSWLIILILWSTENVEDLDNIETLD